MLLLVKPIYGWGWYGPENAQFEVPPPFELEAVTIDADAPFREVLGQLTIQDHPLSGLWIYLSQRTEGYFNLRAYAIRPSSRTTPDDISGYAQAEIKV